MAVDLAAPASTGIGDAWRAGHRFNPMMGGIGGLIGAGLGSLLGGGDYGMSYLQDLTDQLPGIYQPYMKHGEEMYGPLAGQLGGLMSDPGGRLNQIGAGYHESPGFKFQMQQALQGADHAAAAGGMAGTPQHQQQSQALATQLANQDYNNWMRNALGMYGQGLSGAQNIYGMGEQAAGQYGNALSQALATQAQQAAAQQQQQQQGLGGLLGGIGSLIGFL